MRGLLPAKLETTEMHTGGEPVRIVTSGYPPIPGDTILAKRRYARENLDHLRKLLMFEPRGHFDMYGVSPVEPDSPAPISPCCSSTTRATAPCAAMRSSRSAAGRSIPAA